MREKPSTTILWMTGAVMGDYESNLVDWSCMPKWFVHLANKDDKFTQKKAIHVIYFVCRPIASGKD